MDGSESSLPIVEVEVVQEDPELPLPNYQHRYDSGMDAHAAVDVSLEPLQRELIPTGLRVAVPPGYEMQVRSRSGLALKHGVVVLNSPGTVDAGYRGPVGVILINLGSERFQIRRGERVAQLVFAPVCQARWKVVSTLSESARGAGGFGSTSR